MNNLPGDYIAGFVDGEGCFSLKFRRDKHINKINGNIREYFYWGSEFAIQLKHDDVDILNSIQKTLNCGSINKMANGTQVRFSVQNVRDNNEKVIPFFKKYKLRAKKSFDFELWTKAVGILSHYKNGQLNVQVGKKGFTKKEINEEDLLKLKEIRNEMLTYKATRDKLFKWGN